MDISQHQCICRTCLTDATYYKYLPIYSESEIKDEVGVKQMLETCVPKMILDIPISPVICEECNMRLKVVYEFITCCLDTEKKIYSYVANKIDLGEVISAHVDLKQEIEITESHLFDGGQYDDFHNRHDKIEADMDTAIMTDTCISEEKIIQDDPSNTLNIMPTEGTSTSTNDFCYVDKSASNELECIDSRLQSSLMEDSEKELLKEQETKAIQDDSVTDNTSSYNMSATYGDMDITIEFSDDSLVNPLPSDTPSTDTSSKDLVNEQVKKAKRSQEIVSGSKAEINHDMANMTCNVAQDTVVITPALVIGSKRIRNKKHVCYFCRKAIVRIAKHLEFVHSNEIEVSKLLTFPRLSKSRKKGFLQLLRAGDFYHNCDVLKFKKGELILTRRPSEIESKFVSYSEYGPCPYCLGFMLKKHLWHHVSNMCKKNISHLHDSVFGRRGVSSESNALLNCILGYEFPEEYMTQIVEFLRSDDIGNTCRGDNLILRCGFVMYQKHGVAKDELCRQCMRQLARLLIYLRSETIETLPLVDFLVPEKFDLVVRGTKVVCGNEPKVISRRSEYQIPSLAIKLGYSLKKCINIQRGIAMRNGNLTQNSCLLAFSSLMDTEWNTRLSADPISTVDTEEQSQVKSTDVRSVNTDGTKEHDETESTNVRSVNTGLGLRLEASSHEIKSVPRCNMKAMVVKSKWTNPEKKAVSTFFRAKIKKGIVPGKQECNKCLEQNPSLKNREWRHIKYFVKNEITKIKKL